MLHYLNFCILRQDIQRMLLQNTQQSSSVRFSPKCKISEDTIIYKIGPHQKVFLWYQGGSKKKKGFVHLILSLVFIVPVNQKATCSFPSFFSELGVHTAVSHFLPSPRRLCLSGIFPFLKYVSTEQPPAVVSAGPRGAGVWHGAVPDLFSQRPPLQFPALPTPRHLNPICS